MILSNSKIILRAVEPTDLDTLFVLENTTERTEAGFTTAPLSRFQLSEYIKNCSNDIFAEHQLRLMIVDVVSNTTVGAIDIADFVPRDRRGFVGVAILEKYRRQGYACAALNLLCKFATKSLGMHQLVAQVACNNFASRALFEACGFSVCATLPDWVRCGSSYVEVLIYKRVLDNH